MNKKNVLYLGGAGLLGIIGLSLIVHSCSQDTPVAQQQAPAPQAQYAPPPQQYQAAPPPTVVYNQAPPEDHFWRDMAVYHMLFGSSQRTVVVHQPVYVPPAYTPPAVSKTVQNITINQTVNHAPTPAANPAPAAVAPLAPKPMVTANYAPAAPVQKSSWWTSTPAQTVKASTSLPKATGSWGGGSGSSGSYSSRSSGYSSYSSRSSYSSSSSFRSSGRR